MQFGDLSLFLIISPLIQLPLFVFLLLSIQHALGIQIVMICMLVLMLVEFILGVRLWFKNAEYYQKQQWLNFPFMDNSSSTPYSLK